MAPRSTGKGAKKKSESHSDSNNSNTDQQANPADAAPVVNEDDQPSVSAGHSSDLLLNGSEEFNDSLQKHIVEALCTPQVIEVITKAVTEAIMETVTQKVYESVDLDLQAKLAKMKKLEEDIMCSSETNYKSNIRHPGPRSLQPAKLPTHQRPS